MVDPSQDPSGRVGLVIPARGGEVTHREIRTSFDRLTGNPTVKKKFLKIVRKILGDLGMSVVGPLPFRILEIMWQYFGEEHFSAHGRACWCRLCRSIGPARFSFLQSLCDGVVHYLWQVPLHVAKALFVPAPLRTAHFVFKEVLRWFEAVMG